MFTFHAAWFHPRSRFNYVQYKKVGFWFNEDQRIEMIKEGASEIERIYRSIRRHVTDRASALEATMTFSKDDTSFLEDYRSFSFWSGPIWDTSVGPEEDRNAARAGPTIFRQGHLRLQRLCFAVLVFALPGTRPEIPQSLTLHSISALLGLEGQEVRSYIDCSKLLDGEKVSRDKPHVHVICARSVSVCCVHVFVFELVSCFGTNGG